MEKPQHKLIAIVGQTASGKSALAVKLAKKFGGEIISADSRQVYRGLDVGTGKITKKEMGGVPHHLLDVADPKRKFTVAQFQKKAYKTVEDIHAQGKLPILCGGTGLYIQAVVDGIVFPEVKPDMKLRKGLERKSAAELAAMLKKLDKKRYGTIDTKNPRRLIRAIEIAKSLGKVPSPVRTPERFDTLIIGIKPANEVLKKKIEKRLDERLKQGMVREAKRLHTQGLSLRRMKELGLEYKYLAMHLDNEISRSEMREILLKEIWKYAKRQLTWFKKDKRIRWFNPAELGEIKKEIIRFLGKPK